MAEGAQYGQAGLWATGSPLPPSHGGLPLGRGAARAAVLHELRVPSQLCCERRVTFGCTAAVWVSPGWPKALLAALCSCVHCSDNFSTVITFGLLLSPPLRSAVLPFLQCCSGLPPWQPQWPFQSEHRLKRKCLIKSQPKRLGYCRLCLWEHGVNSSSADFSAGGGMADSPSNAGSVISAVLI